MPNKTEDREIKELAENLQCFALEKGDIASVEGKTYSTLTPERCISIAETLINLRGWRKSALVPLEKSKVYELLDKYKFAQGYVEFVNDLCDSFGTAKVLSVVRLRQIIAEHIIKHQREINHDVALEAAKEINATQTGETE